MPEIYQPTSRRPIADVFRQTARGCVRLCVRVNVHPDAISYASIAASLLAGGCFIIADRHLWLLLIGPLLCYLRLWFNMLDGMVAVAAGKASRRGEILNDLPDRFSDVIVFTAVAESGLCHPSLAYWTALAAVLTAYVGMMAQAVGAPRQYGGWMSKPWRMVVLNIGAWGTWAMMTTSGRRTVVFQLSAFDCACIIILLGCVQTIALRLRRTLAALAQTD